MSAHDPEHRWTNDTNMRYWRERAEKAEARVDQLECPDPDCHPDLPQSHIVATLQDRIAELERVLVNLGVQLTAGASGDPAGGETE